jgi:ABC-type Fe3+-hydroxamate transport system substrate-binding protein
MALRAAQRRYKNRGPRRNTTYAPGGENRVARRTPITATITDVTGSVVTVDFNVPVVVAGNPGYTDSSGTPKTVVSTAVNSPTQIALTFSGPPTGPMIIPFEDPAVRNMAGGYVLPGTLAFPG